MHGTASANFPCIVYEHERTLERPCAGDHFRSLEPLEGLSLKPSGVQKGCRNKCLISFLFSKLVELEHGHLARTSVGSKACGRLMYIAAEYLALWCSAEVGY